MITLKQLNLTEQELDDVLCFIYESEEPEDAVNYTRFIKTDALIDQKLKMLTVGNTLGEGSEPFFIIKRIIESSDCGCSDVTSTWKRQRNIAECQATQILKILESAVKTSFENTSVLSEMEGRLEKLQEKVLNYDDTYNVPLSEGGWKTIFGFFLLGPSGWLIYRAIRAALSEKSRRCGALGVGRVRDVCLWKARQEEQIKMAALVKKEMKNCKESKNPAKCSAKGSERAAGMISKAKKLADKIKNYQMKSPKKAGKTEEGMKKAADPAGKVV